ncbi:hypothetical protein [Plantactinospora sp. KLBMP9567]|uniref:hypothetical protein n=1 Tax=Plantactinospora sp. KLBMP9567 TaxID=3085900 RepID=UPI0029828A09|nr:hypothetical protein [Plantactinospora sp. KLBMP9567]MDW5322464.1 hypothetical protein [Plantactinospora sp. KLBMP9567]
MGVPRHVHDALAVEILALPGGPSVAPYRYDEKLAGLLDHVIEAFPGAGGAAWHRWRARTGVTALPPTGDRRTTARDTCLSRRCRRTVVSGRRIT